MSVAARIPPFLLLTLVTPLLRAGLSRTESRKSLAKQRRELEILQALGPAPADPHQLVRTPSARARGNQTELARLEAGNTQEEIASVEAEIMRLKAELGLQDRV